MSKKLTEEDRQKNCLGKLTWATPAEARAAVAYAAWQYGGEGGRPRPYRCEYCNKWHLARHHDD